MNIIRTLVSSQKELGMTRQKYKLKIHTKENDLLELKQAVDALKVRHFQNCFIKIDESSNVLNQKQFN